MHTIILHFQVPVDVSMKKIWQPNVLAGSSDPVFQKAMRRYFDMADDDKNGPCRSRARASATFSREARPHLRRRVPVLHRPLLPSLVVAAAQGRRCFNGCWCLLHICVFELRHAGQWRPYHCLCRKSPGAVFVNLNCTSVHFLQSLLGAAVTEGDIIAELVELVVCALDKGEMQMMAELHGEESTPRLGDGTAVTLNMACTLTSGRGGAFRQNSEVQVVSIDPSGNTLVIQLRDGQTMQLQSNPHPFTFKDLQASISFDMLLGMGSGSASAADDTNLECAFPT